MLFLKDCKINSLGGSFIYKGVRKYGKLREIVLDKNDLRGKSVFELASMLFTNHWIKKLSLEDCNL